MRSERVQVLTFLLLIISKSQFFYLIKSLVRAFNILIFIFLIFFSFQLCIICRRREKNIGLFECQDQGVRDA